MLQQGLLRYKLTLTETQQETQWLSSNLLGCESACPELPHSGLTQASSLAEVLSAAASHLYACMHGGLPACLPLSVPVQVPKKA